MLDIPATIGPAHILKPPFGSDLLKELENFVRAQGINLAWVSGIGAVSRATVRYYDQPNQTYADLEFDREMEVVGMLGNISLMNGEPVVHLHVTLADDAGHCFGGHLGHNTLVFNMEILVTTLSGPLVTRKLDQRTGLTIWH